MCKENKEAAYLEQKQSRNTHPEKSVAIFPDEECTTKVI